MENLDAIGDGEQFEYEDDEIDEAESVSLSAAEDNNVRLPRRDGQLEERSSHEID